MCIADCTLVVTAPGSGFRVHMNLGATWGISCLNTIRLNSMGRIFIAPFVRSTLNKIGVHLNIRELQIDHRLGILSARTAES